MTTESQTASESASGLRGASGRPLLASGRRWRLPIAYGSIASVALGLDLALILGSATFAETVYHKIPDEFEGGYSRYPCGGYLLSPFCSDNAMRVQKLYKLHPPDGVGRPELAPCSAPWCGALLILASGVSSWGPPPPPPPHLVPHT